MLRIVMIFVLVYMFTVAAKIGWRAYQNYQGVCADTGTRLSDDEVVAIAEKSAWLMRNAHVRMLKEEDATNLSVGDEISQERFASENSNCCSLVRLQDLRAEEQEHITAFARMQGHYRTWIRINYSLPDGTAFSGLKIVFNCGKVRGSVF